MNCTDSSITNDDYESHPNIDSIYDDMMEQASPVCSPVPSVPREHVKTFTVSTKLYDGAEDDDHSLDDNEGLHRHHRQQQQQQHQQNNTYIISTKTFDGCVAPSPNKKKCFSRKNSTDSAYSLSTAGGGGGGGFSRKNSNDSVYSRKNSTDSSAAADNVGGQQQKKKKSKKNWRDTRRISTDSTAGLGLYNDDEQWTQRISEIMNRGFVGGGGGVEVPSSSPSLSRDPPPTPIDGVKESVRVAPPLPPTSSSSSRSRCRSTDYLSSQSKNKSGGGGPSFSRRGSMEGRDINNTFARKNSRSTSPKFIPPIDTFSSDSPDATTASSNPKRGFTRRNSMTRSRSPKFVEPLTTGHDESRVFQGRLRRHSMEGPNPFTSRQLETLREKRAEELSNSGDDDDDDDDDESSVDDNIAEMVRRRLEGLGEPSTPTPPKGDNDEDSTVPRKPFSRHNSIEGVVDTSIFPSLPSLEQKKSNDEEANPNFDLAMLFQHLVEDNMDDDDEDDEEDLIVGEDSDTDDDGDDDNIIKRHSKIRRRCSTGGLRTFERENLRNFLEDNEGDDDDAEAAAEAASRRRSFFKRCSTGGLRTLQRENSRDMYSDDSSLDGKRGRVPLADDNSSFEKYLRKMTQEAVVDTSNDVHIIEDHVNREMTRQSSRDSDDDGNDDNIIKRHSKIRRRCSTGGLRTFERENLRNFLEDNEGDDDDAEAAAEAASRRRSFFKRCSTGGLRTLQRENSRDMYSDDSSLDGREGRLPLADDSAFEKYLQRMTQEAVVDTSEDVHIIEDHVGRGMPRRSSIRSVSSAVEEEDSNDFAAFISRVGMGVDPGISSSQTVATVSTAANTSYAEDSHVSRNEVEAVRSSAVKKTYPHSIHMPHSNGSSNTESVSSLENSTRQGGGSVCKVNVPTTKTSSEVHFKSSKSRSIRRLASKDGIDELKKFADGIDAPATLRSSGGSITEPDLGDVVLKDLPDLIKDIDRDLVTERAVYRKRQSGDASTVEASILSEERKEESGVTVQFNLTQPRKNLEPAGASACSPDEDGLQKPRKQEINFSMEDSFLTTEAQSNYIRKGSVDQQRGEIPPVPMIAMGEIPDGAAYQPKRRRSSTRRTEDRQRSDKKSKSRERSSYKQGKPLDEKRRKELTKNSPFRNNKDGSSLREGSIAALKGLRRKLSSGGGI